MDSKYHECFHRGAAVNQWQDSGTVGILHTTNLKNQSNINMWERHRNLKPFQYKRVGICISTTANCFNHCQSQPNNINKYDKILTTVTGLVSACVLCNHCCSLTCHPNTSRMTVIVSNLDFCVNEKKEDMKCEFLNIWAAVTCFTALPVSSLATLTVS